MRSLLQSLALLWHAKTAEHGYVATDSHSSLFIDSHQHIVVLRAGSWCSTPGKFFQVVASYDVTGFDVQMRLNSMEEEGMLAFGQVPYQLLACRFSILLISIVQYVSDVSGKATVSFEG